MTDESRKPILLQPPIVRSRTRAYSWVGFPLGALVGFYLIHPVSMVVRAVHDAIYYGAPLSLDQAFTHSFHGEMWPMMLLYTVLGASVGGVLGIILKRLKEHRERLDTLHQEFELQVATLRHHYKNLAIGIQGFARRISKKLTGLETQLRQCALEGASADQAHQDCEALAHNVEILEDAAQRLTQTLGQELLFLKALTSDSLIRRTRDFYPLLISSIKELMGLRFRDKDIRVEINGKPLEECQDSLVFAFEPYTMEVILQNILSNSMKFGDHIQVAVREIDSWVQVEVKDNGPGMEVDKLKHQILLPSDRREAESTHLGLKVSLHLIVKNGGRLSAWSKPGAGATFFLEFPKYPPIQS